MLHATCYMGRFAVLLALAFLLHASIALAQGFVPLAPIEAEGSEFTQSGCSQLEVEGEGDWVADATTQTKKWVWDQKPSCLPKYLRTVYNTGIALAGLFLVFSIVRGGFELMFTDSILGKLEGKKIILQALGGAVVVYASWLLMTAINPQLGKDLNLSLVFPRVEVKAIREELSPEDTELAEQLARGAEAQGIRNEIEAHEQEKKEGKISGEEAAEKDLELEIKRLDQSVKDARTGMNLKYSAAKGLLKPGATDADINKVESEVIGEMLRHANFMVTALEQKMKLLYPDSGSGATAIVNEIKQIITERAQKRQALVNFIAYRRRCPYDATATTKGISPSSPCLRPPPL